MNKIYFGRWCNILIALLLVITIIDYTLYASGNLSILFGTLGAAIGLLIIVVEVVLLFITRNKQLFSILIVLVIVASVLSYLSFDYAKGWSEDTAMSIICNLGDIEGTKAEYITDVIMTNNKELGCALNIIDKTAFVPSHRRHDYLIEGKSGQQYHLVLFVSGMRNNKVSLRKLDGSD